MFMHQRRVVGFLIILLLAAGAVAPLAVRAARPQPPASEQPLRGLSSLDGGVAGFLSRRNSALATMRIGDQTAAQIIENTASYYNIEARIILALLETTSGVISAPTLPVTATERPFRAGPHGFAAQIDWAAREIRAGFGPYDVAPTVIFREGARRTLDLNDQPHALTVKRFLARERSLVEWEQLVSRYPGVYKQLFDNEPTVAPPTPVASRGFLSIPWVPGTRVIHSSYFDHTYPMVDSGGDGNDTMIDYLGRAGGSYNSHDGHDYYFPDQPFGTPIVAAAPGWAFARTTRGLGVLIQHTGVAAGYESVYWHLEDFAPSFDQFVDSATPRWVERGELLGWSGATGFTDGAPHLHFELRHNGNQVDPYGWYGPGTDPCVQYVKCEASIWLWDDSVPWTAPDAPTRADTTPPSGLLTLNPPGDIRLLAQFDGTPLSTIGPGASSEGVGFSSGKWDQAVRVGSGDSLTYPTSPTLNLERGTLALWVDVPATWPGSQTGRHYLVAASENPADPARVYSGTLALRHEQRDGDPVWTFWTVPISTGLAHELTVPDTLSAGWHHFAISWEVASGTKTLFIDGAPVATATNVALPTDVGEELQLSRWTTGGVTSNALIDDLVSYDHALDHAAVQDLASRSQALQGSAERTANRELTLLTPALDNGGGVVQAQLGLNGVYAAPLPYYRAYRWTLPSEEGTYTVSVRLTDRMGNVSTLERAISVDHPPQAELRVRNLSPLTATLALSATDANQPLEMALSSQANPQIKRWEPLKTERTWYWLPMNPRRVYVWFRDANGNERGPFVAGPDLWRAYLPRIDR
jgi:murein DD-endopeptidase MepM/ murein hydrolase activator NlpD